MSRIAVSGSLGTRTGHADACYGVTALAMRVGLRQGRLSMISQDATLPVLGHGVLRRALAVLFNGYTTTAAAPG